MVQPALACYMAKKHLLDTMPPYQGGGDMIETVAFIKITYAKCRKNLKQVHQILPVSSVLHAAIKYLQTIGMENIFAHEQALLHYAEAQLVSYSRITHHWHSKTKSGRDFFCDGWHSSA